MFATHLDPTLHSMISLQSTLLLCNFSSLDKSYVMYIRMILLHLNVLTVETKSNFQSTILFFNDIIKVSIFNQQSFHFTEDAKLRIT